MIDPRTWTGTRDQPSSRLLTSVPHQLDLPISHSDFHSRTSTRLEVLERYQSVESRPESSSQVWLLPSLLTASPLRSSPSRCTTRPCQRPFQETTSDSTSRTFPSRKLREDTSPLTARTILLPEPPPSSPRLSS